MYMYTLQHEVEAKLQHQNYARKQSVCHNYSPQKSYHVTERRLILQAARMNQAKKAAARSWRSTLSSGGEDKEEHPPQPPKPVREEKREPSKPDSMETVQKKALEPKCVK